MPDDGAPGAANAGRGAERSERRADDVSVRELTELRDLLFGGERRQLDELRRRLDTFEVTPEELAEVLPQAIAHRTKRDRQLAIALAPTVESALSESVRRNPREIATAIFPVLGPAIRKAIAETMSDLVSTINRAIEHSLSPRGIRWRIESWRTGVPFAQIVIRHALVYRVEQVFLVHAETGLLLAHVPEDTGGDADLISSMLTAIGDFVNDSFEPKQTGELRAFAAGDVTVLVETGPKAYVAAVVRGQAPESLPLKLRTTLESIHLHWYDPLGEFSGDSTAFVTTRPLLSDCVEMVLTTDQRAAARAATRASLVRFAWAIPVALAIALLAWWATSGGRRWKAALARLESEPGITVIRSERRGGRWHVDGMRDPLAANPAAVFAAAGIDTTDVVGRWNPYVSTDPRIALARARRTLAPPASVTLAMSGDALTASGSAPATWIARAETLAPALVGVSAVDLSKVTPGLPAALDSLRAAIESRRILFPVGSATLDDLARSTAGDVGARVRALIAAGGRNGYIITLVVVGRTDPSGQESENLALSRRRALAVRDYLASIGVPETEPSATGSANPIDAVGAERARVNRSVSFVVQARPAASDRAAAQAARPTPERVR